MRKLVSSVTVTAGIAMLVAIALQFAAASDSGASTTLRKVHTSTVPALRAVKPSVFTQTTPRSPIYRLEEPGTKYNYDSGSIYRTKFRVTKFTRNGRLVKKFGRRGTTKTIKVGRVGENWDYRVVPLRDGRVAVFGSIGGVTGRTAFDLGYSITMFRSTGKIDKRFAKAGQFIVRYKKGNPRRGAFAADAAVPLGRSGIALCGTLFYLESRNQIGAIRVFRKDGQLDTNFGDGGTLTLNGAFMGNQLGTSACYAARGGNSIVGAFESYGVESPMTFNDYDNELIRVTSRGNLDRSFGTGGRTVFPRLPFGKGSFSGEVFSMTSDRKGRFLVHNHLYSPDVDSFAALYRMNKNGTVDTSFSRDGVVKLPQFANVVAPRADGSLLIGGEATAKKKHGRKYESFVAPATMSLNENGTSDRRWGKRGYKIFKNYNDPIEQFITVRGRQYFVGPVRYRKGGTRYPGPRLPFFYVKAR